MHSFFDAYPDHLFVVESVGNTIYFLVHTSGYNVVTLSVSGAEGPESASAVSVMALTDITKKF